VKDFFFVPVSHLAFSVLVAGVLVLPRQKSNLQRTFVIFVIGCRQLAVVVQD
jgi:hypothetical protein